MKEAKLSPPSCTHWIEKLHWFSGLLYSREYIVLSGTSGFRLWSLHQSEMIGYRSIPLRISCWRSRGEVSKSPCHKDKFLCVQHSAGSWQCFRFQGGGVVAPLKTSRRQKWKVLPVSRLKVSSEWKVPVLWITTIKCCQALSTLS